jgi:polysaccharide deacetylase family protein (PEP-CTERM system associated)
MVLTLQPREQLCVFSVDIEDWFHILALPTSPDVRQWDSLPSRVEENSMRLFDLFSEYDVSVTLFFLGWVAERFPSLVREASARGHEIASHGYAHMLVYQMTPAEFYEDIHKSKELIEQIGGRPVLGYRSPGFSVTAKTPWFFDKLAEAGYLYDSSVFPGVRQHGGMVGSGIAPHEVRTHLHPIREFPISVVNVLGTAICFFGGGYLRLSPYACTRYMARRVLAEGRPVIFYVHPREIDPSHPRLRMNPVRRFKSYVNLGTTEGKLRRIVTDFRVTSFERYMQETSARVCVA